MKHTMILDNIEYETVNSFQKFGRSKKYIQKIEAFYLDIDFYKSEMYEELFLSKIYDDFSNLQLELNNIKEYFMLYCKKNNLPSPTRIVFSGRGFYLYWDIISTKSNQQYKPTTKTVQLYETVEKELIKIFAELGADPVAHDVTRILKKTDQELPTYISTQTLYENFNNKITFEQMVIATLPYTPKQVKEYLALEKEMPRTDRQLKLYRDLQNELKELGHSYNAYPRLSKFGISNQIDRLKQLKKEYILKTNSPEKKLKINKNKRVYNNKQLNNTNYILSFLNRGLRNGYIKEGNRSYFFFYYSKGLLIQEQSFEDIMETLEFINNEYNLDFSITEIKAAYSQAIKNDNKIKTKTLENHLGYKTLPKKKKVTKTDKEIKAIKKKKKELFFQNIKYEQNISLRDLAVKYEVSHEFIRIYQVVYKTCKDFCQGHVDRAERLFKRLIKVLKQKQLKKLTFKATPSVVNRIIGKDTDLTKIWLPFPTKLQTQLAYENLFSKLKDNLEFELKLIE